MIPTVIPAGVPLPPADTWGQFPVVALIALCFILAGVGLRLVWKDYAKERDKDRAWRETQNEKRELAQAEQNQLWREAMKERDERWEELDKEKQGTLKEIAQASAIILSSLKEHDLQAKDIKKTVEEINGKLPKRPRGG